jgi:hypothetical protein
MSRDAREVAFGGAYVVVVSPMITTIVRGGTAMNPLVRALFLARIGRRAGYLVKYQSSGFIRPNALAA